MGMHKIAKMPSPEELKEEMPLSEEAKQIKAARDKEIRDVFTGASDKFLVIIGPCSADNETAVMDYLGRLARVQKDLADKLLIIPRIYTNKPRTTGDGYKGMVHQPDPEKAPDMASGLRSVRKLHMEALEEFHACCRRNALSRKLAIYGRSFILCCRWSSFCREPAASFNS